MNSAQDNEILNVPKSNLEKTKLDLDSPGIAKAVARRVLEDIDAYCQKAYDDGPRSHLGASQIGHKCSRYLWYVFRWCLHEKFDGRMLRLFNRGHREEARFIEWLEGIGAQVWAFDQDGKQIRITGVMGHFGGSLDCVIKLPPEYQIEEPILGEFKTNGTGKAFNALAADGMILAKPMHFAQTSTYGEHHKFRYVLYMNINKNDDSIHVELVKLNHKLGEQMKLKAQQIILSQTPPPRLSDNPTFTECAYCAMKGLCHKNETPMKNCRSCLHAEPVENGEWLCQASNAIIPKDFIPIGCNAWKAVTEQ